MKITYKYSLPIEKLSKLDTHKMGAYAVAQLVNLDHLKIVLASPQEKNVDLAITNKKSKKRYRMKVLSSKEPSKNTSVGMGLSWMISQKDMNLVDDDLFFCFVHLTNNKNEINLRFFVVPSAEVSKYVKDSFEFWLNELDSRDENNEVRKFLLGEEGEEYPPEFKTLLQNDYEDKWDLLK